MSYDQRITVWGKNKNKYYWMDEIDMQKEWLIDDRYYQLPKYDWGDFLYNDIVKLYRDCKTVIRNPEAAKKLFPQTYEVWGEKDCAYRAERALRIIKYNGLLNPYIDHIDYHHEYMWMDEYMEKENQKGGE